MSGLGDALRRSETVQVSRGVVTPPRAVQAAYDALEPEERPLLTERLHSSESAEDLAYFLTTNGYPISASAIRTYRRLARLEASNV